MNKIKDIIYDKSDILIALLILAIAALIIFWRLGIILEYPKDIVGGGGDSGNVLTEPTEESDAEQDITDDGTGDSEAGDQEQGETADQQADDQTASDDQSADQQAGTDQSSEQGDAADQEGSDDNENSSEASGGSLWDGDKLSKDYEVTITGNTASAAVQSLIDAGVFADYSEYQKICQENGFDHEKMRAGVFTFKKGSTKLDIIKMVNWTKG